MYYVCICFRMAFPVISCLVPTKDTNAAKKKKGGKRVKWSDHFGNPLTEFQLVEGREALAAGATSEVDVSWSDRKKRDRMREKELLLKVKYVSLF